MNNTPSNPVSVSVTQTAITKALVEAQHEIASVPRKHTMNIAGRGTYKYAGLDDVLEAVKKVTAKHGLALVMKIDGEALHTTLLHISGEFIDYGRYPLGTLTKHQDRGSAITYARRYTMNCVFNIATEDDDDAVGADSGNVPQASASRASTALNPSKQASSKSPFGSQFERDTWLMMYKAEMGAASTKAALTGFRKQREVYVERMKVSGEPADTLALTDIATHYKAAVERIEQKERVNVLPEDEIPF